MLDETPTGPSPPEHYSTAGFWLATTIEAHEAIVNGEPVPRSLLKPDRLAAIGEKPYGHDFVLTPQLALACELASQAAQVNGDQPQRLLQFAPLTEFVQYDYPPPDPLLGDPDTILYLAKSTLLLCYGDGGAGKSTLTIDAAAHLAAGRDWLDIHVHRPCRILLLENEGGASLYQAKLQHKISSWDGPADWAANILIYTEPWGRFTFASEQMRTELAEYCTTMNVDVVMANPLFGVGGPGSGRPDETGLFVDWMKEAGLWNGGPAFWLLHHENKLGQISGDWGRQPDTTIQLETDGDAPRSKLFWEKTRWKRDVPEGWRRTMLLDWITETMSYQPLDVDINTTTDSQLSQRLDTYLEEHPWHSKTTITENVKGNTRRLRSLLEQGVEHHRYMTRTGSRGATLFALLQDGDTDPVLTLEDGRTVDTATPHEQRDTTPSYLEDGDGGSVKGRGTNTVLRPPYREDGVREDGRAEGTTDVQQDADDDIPF